MKCVNRTWCNYLFISTVSPFISRPLMYLRLNTRCVYDGSTEALLPLLGVIGVRGHVFHQKLEYQRSSSPLPTDES